MVGVLVGLCWCAKFFRVYFYFCGCVCWCMTRKAPLAAVAWQKFVEEGEVRCRGCDTMVDLSDADDINEAIALWNDHVADCEAAPE